MATRTDLANAIRALSMDAVEKAKSGHPGAPMGMAEIAEVVWNHHLRHNPTNPKWADRDRFVLSNGHGSMLIYSLLHLTGYDLSIEDIKNFRQLHSRTPGHPELGYTPGVETTTGPLGQGITNAVGMALAEKLLAAEFNKPGHEIVNHHTYVFMGDGCMMEGISHEACALAATWGLGKLIACWDDNGISIDGHTDGWFTEDVCGRFEAYGWHVVRNVDGHSSAAVEAAVQEAKMVSDKPTMIQCKTIIGKGSPNKEGTHDVHGAALGNAEIEATRAHIGWNHPPFEIPADVYEGWNCRTKGEGLEKLWDNKFAEYTKAFPEDASEFERRTNNELPIDWDARVEAALATTLEKAETVATRKASQLAIERLISTLPERVGGSADLTGSNLTNWPGCQPIHRHAKANYISYGVREFGMSHIMNGMALHGGLFPFGGTFLMFSEYARNALRMSALMKQRVVYVFTHDSIGLGEDGPTHQAVEQVASLRAIPNLIVIRPGDANETAVAWRVAIETRKQPVALILSRQDIPTLDRTQFAAAEGLRRGAYILADAPQGKPQVILIASGSEVGLVVAAGQQLQAQNISTRLVSMPSWELFEAQTQAYRDDVLPPSVTARLSVEAGVTQGWHKYVGDRGAVIGVDRFGASAPGPTVMREYGFSVEHVCRRALALTR
jgi:transketolase